MSASARRKKVDPFADLEEQAEKLFNPRPKIEPLPAEPEVHLRVVETPKPSVKATSAKPSSGKRGKWSTQAEAMDITNDVLLVPMSEFRWNPEKGLMSAKRWIIELARCKRVKPTPKALAGLYREFVAVGWSTSGAQKVPPGCVTLSEDKILTLTGWSRSAYYAHKKVLKDQGWITETGWYFNGTQAQIMRLTVPVCDCGGPHGEPLTLA